MSYKTNRTASELQKSISLIIQNKLRNPDVSPLATITEVTVSKDLRYATVYVSTFDDTEKTVSALNNSAGFINRELSFAMKNMRTVPTLVFKSDASAEYGRKIDSILRGLENEFHSESD